MDFWGIISVFAPFFGCCALIPEIMKALKSHHLKDVSRGMLWLLLTCSSLWFFYGILRDELSIVVSAGFNVIMEMILLMLKNNYEHKKTQNFEPYYKNSLGKKAAIETLTAHRSL